MSLKIWSDGATTGGNPGQITWGIYIEGEDWGLGFGGVGDKGTSYKAELTAFHTALRFCSSLGLYKPTIYMDAKSCIKVCSGEYKPRKHSNIVKEIQDMIDRVRPTIEHVTSSNNKGHRFAQECKLA